VMSYRVTREADDLRAGWRFSAENPGSPEPVEGEEEEQADDERQQKQDKLARRLPTPEARDGFSLGQLIRRGSQYASSPMAALLPAEAAPAMATAQ